MLAAAHYATLYLAAAAAAEQVTARRVDARLARPSPVITASVVWSWRSNPDENDNRNKTA